MRVKSINQGWDIFTPNAATVGVSAGDLAIYDQLHSRLDLDIFASSGLIFVPNTLWINSYQILTESAAPSIGAGYAYFWADSTAHRLKMVNNNGSPQNIIGTSDMPLRATSAAYAPGALSGGACATQTATSITGATTSMVCSVTPVSDPGTGFSWQGIISSGGCAVRICNTTSGSLTPSSTAYNIAVIQ